MSKNKIFSILALFLALFMVACVVSAASDHITVSDADDGNNTLKFSNDLWTKESTLNTSLENKNVENNGGTVSNDSKSDIDTSFTQLAKDISNSDGVLNLTHDYTYDPTKDTAYKEGIIITIDLIINGNNYIIDGSHTARAFNITSGILIINNLTITNCSSNTKGDAIYNNGSLIVTGSSFINCSGESGGAIYNCDDVLTVVASSFINCSSGYAGAIRNYDGSLNVTGSSFINCSSYYDGGVIYNYGSLNVTGSSFINCSSYYDGGVIYNYEGSSKFTSSSFINCSAGESGGAIYNCDDVLTVVASSFINCSTSKYGGGAIYNSYNNHFYVTGSIFDNCTSPNGIIYIYKGTYDLNGNYWGMNCTTVDEFKVANLIMNSTTSSFAPDNWIVMNITNSSKIIADENNTFSATLNTLQDGADYSGNLPDYETVISDNNGKSINLNISNGISNFNYTPVSEGNFSLVARSLNSGKLLTNSTFTAVKPDKLNTTIIASDMEIPINTSEYFIATLKDKNGKRLPNKNITFAFNGTTYNRTTSLYGIAYFTITPGSVGSYPVLISFAGDDNYNSASATVKVKVIGSDKLNTSIVASDMEIPVNTSKNLTATLKDENGNVLTNKNITFTFNGSDYTRTTDSNGEAYLTITPSVADGYPVTISFAGDDDYESANATVNVKVYNPYVTISQIMDSSVNLNNYITKYGKVPSTVTVNGVKYTTTQFTYLLSAALKNLNSNKSVSTKIEVINVTASNVDYNINITATKDQYLSVVNTVYSKSSSGTLPSYVSVGGKNAVVNTYTYALSRALEFYKNNNRLPDSLLFTSYF